MINRLLRVLSASEELPDAAELADALWLAGHMPEHSGAAGPRAASAPSGTRKPIPGHGSPAGLSRTVDAQASVHLAAPGESEGPSLRGDGETTGTLASAPAISAMAGAAAIARALRPLRMRVSSPGGGDVDEPATAQRIADTGLWVPELKPASERRLALVLIVDHSASMMVWRSTIAEFYAVLTQLAAFRDIRVVGMDTDAWSAGGLSGSADLPSRRLVLVLSDCVGQAWADGTVFGWLEQVARAGPVAIVQMLPQRLWAGCGLAFTPVRLKGGDPVDPRLRIEYRGGGESGGAGVPIPVLELDARWLGPWASALAGQAAEPIAGMAVYTRDPAAPVQLHDPGNAHDRITLFRSAASPTALKLATYLAAAPLNLPVMRLVQHVMLPASRPADLAEVFLSGLLRRVAHSGRGTVEFDFYPGVREILLGALRRAEAIRVLRLVSAHIGERLGSSPEFSAIFAPGAAGSAGARGPLTEPFATLALTVLRSVGGQYREIADQLAKDLAETSSHSLSSLDLPGSGLPTISGEPVPVTHSLVPTTISTGGLTVPDTTSARPTALWRGVPPKNPNFTGREDVLLALRSQLSTGITALVPVALHGLGGVGKTQIAIEFIYRFAADYDLICWVSGEVPMQLRSDLAAIGPDLNVPTGGDLAQTLSAVCDALDRGQPYSRWLLVVDNADEPAELLPLLPQAGGHILITSRNQTWSGFAQTFGVAEFTRDESISLIRRRGRGISQEDAGRLAEALGDLPIAVEQAAAWQAESGMSVRRYLTLLEDQITTLLTENPPAGYKLSVVAAWVLAFDDLQRQSPEGAELVQLCSFLGPEPIPYTLLWSFRHASGLPPDLERMLVDDVLFHRAVRHVGQRALLKVDPGQETLTEHRLVQAVLRERLSAERQAEMTALVWKLLIVANPGRPDDQRNWDMLSTINRHLRASKIVEASDRAARRVVIDQIRFLYNLGDHVSSNNLAEEVVRKWRESSGASDEQTLIASRLLGIVRRDLGLMEEARAINEDTLERCRAVFGPEHEHTLVTANSYACDLRVSGSYAEALALDETLLRQHNAVFGENEESTFRSAHNLAVDMRLNGRYRDAYDLDLDTLRRRRQVLGEKRWETWSSAGTVGRDLRGLGEFAESARYLEEAIPPCSVLLGPEHPEVIRMKMDLAATLRRLGRLDDARKLAEECVELNRRRFGQRHNYTLSAMTTLAELLRLLGQTDRALELADRVVAAAPATYGGDQALITTCEHNFAIKLRVIGEHDRAYALDRVANARFHEILGDRRRRTTGSDMSLAHDLELRGDPAAALPMLRRVVGTSAQIRGSSHPRTLFCAMNLAGLLRDLSETAEAEEIRDGALTALREQLGAGHPEVVLAEAGEFIEFEMELPDR
jgi:tetratricopeptide (TPR) repeat protein